MKILLLNPQFDSQHEVVVALQGRGVVTLVASSADEAGQILGMHGSSVELAVVHREGESPDSGIAFLKRIKADVSQSDLPVIVTSSEWNDEQFAGHQATPEGANAYLRAPFAPEALIGMIEAVFGSRLGADGSDASPMERQPEAGGAVLEGGLEALDIGASQELPSLADLGVPSSAPTSDGVTVAGITLDALAAPDLAPLEEAGAPTFDLGMAESVPPSGILPELPSLPAMDPVVSGMPKAPPASLPGNTGAGPLAVEDAAAVFMRNERKSGATGAIKLEAPELHNDDFPVPGATSEAQREQVAELSQRAREQAAAQREIDEQLERDLAADLAYLAPAGSSPKTPPQHHQQSQRAQQGSTSLVQAVQAALASQASSLAGAAGSFFRPASDAVVPGGTVQSPDTETLKKFLSLREQDVAVLTVQLKTAQEQIAALERSVAEEKGRNSDLQAIIAEHKRKIDDFESQQGLAGEKFESEISELKFQLKARRDKARTLEGQVKEAQNEIEKMKERVRSDIRKIRMREKELENRLEITRRDSEALLAARESKIIELKRKVDLLEFNMDLLQDQYNREKDNSAQLREKLAKAAQVVRVMGGLLDASGALAAEGEGPGAEDAATEAS